MDEEEDNVNEMCNNKDETIHQNVDTPHAGTPLNTSHCKNFGLIKTEGDNKGICIITLNQLFLSSLLFKQEFDQKVMVQRVAGNSTVASVKVRRPRYRLYIYVGVRDIIYLNEGDLLRIRSIQNNLFEYRVVRVDNYKERSSTTTNDDSALVAFASICAKQQQRDNDNKNTDLNDLESRLAQEEEAEKDRLFENEQYGKRLAKEARVAKENHLAKAELPVLMKDSQEAVITSTSHNNNTIALLATKSVTPETYRRKKGTTNRISDPTVETTNKESESQSETETTRLCGGRRYLSDLDSRDPKTDFPTKWMSDHSDYDSEATVGDDERNYQDKLETGNVRAIKIEDDIEILCDRLLAEETENKGLEAAITQHIAGMENKIQGECGLQYWKKRTH